MCLLTFMHAGVTADVEDLRTGALNNPDGFGYAVHAGTKVIANSGLEFDRVLDEFLSVRAKHSGPALFHSRITTHGGTTLDNCHPFYVGRDTLSVVAHNGMLPISAKNGKSDTRIFAEELLPSWGGTPMLNSKRMRKKLSKFAEGSKLVFLSANPDVQNDYTIINEDLGDWFDGVWWSNSSYKWARKTYDTGWAKHDYGTWQNDGDYDYWVPLGKTYDCSYVDPRTGEDVWGELWQCTMCNHNEYIDLDSLQAAEFCPNCDACWYCADDRILCQCYHEPQSELAYDDHQPTLWGYDRSIEQGSMY